jgi:hypothetical protein
MSNEIDEYIRMQKVIFGKLMHEKPLYDLMVTQKIPQEIVLRLLDKLPQHKPDEHFKIDRYVKFIHGKIPSSFQEILEQKPGLAHLDISLERRLDGYTPLIPGDVIYYPCAFGKQEVHHMGIYVGDGFVVNQWWEPGNFAEKFMGLTSWGSPNAYIILISLKDFIPPLDAICDDKNIYILDRETASKYLATPFKSRLEIINTALDMVGPNKYSFVPSLIWTTSKTHNCHSLALNIATGKCGLVHIDSKRTVSKILALKRINDKSLHSAPKNKFKEDPDINIEIEKLTEEYEKSLTTKKQILTTLVSSVSNIRDKITRNLFPY